MALLYLNDISNNNKVNHINKHIKRVIFVPILDSGYETPQFVLGIAVRSYTTNAFVNACRWGYDNFQLKKQEVLMLKLHSRFVRVKLLPLLFSKVCRNFTLQLRHWMKSYKLRKKWTWLNRMLIVCCLGNHWKYPLSSHHHQCGVQSLHIGALWASDNLAQAPTTCQPGTHQTNINDGKPGGNRGSMARGGIPSLSITTLRQRLNDIALPSGSSK